MNHSKLHHSTEHVYWLEPDDRSDRPIIGAVAGSEGSLIVEAGNSPAHLKLFFDEFEKFDLAPPTFLTATHWHWDHVFGASALDAPFIVHRETRDMLANMARLEWSDEALDRRVEDGSEIEFCRDMMKKELSEVERSALEIRIPDVAFATEVELDLGGVSCQIINVGGNHGSDNSVVYVPEDKLLFLGDCTYEAYYNGPVQYNTRKLFPLLDRLLEFDAEIFLFAHSPEPMGKEEMCAYTSRLKMIGRTVERFEGRRDAIMTELQMLFASALSEDDLEYMNSFIAGLT